jgi:hypothetical protein
VTRLLLVQSVKGPHGHSRHPDGGLAIFEQREGSVDVSVSEESLEEASEVVVVSGAPGFSDLTSVASVEEENLKGGGERISRQLQIKYPSINYFITHH